MNKRKVIYTMAAVALATCLNGCKATELESRTTSDTLKKDVKDVKTPHFNPNNLLEKSNLTRDDAYRMLKGSKLQSVSSHYIYAEETYGVNAIFLMGLTSLESGHGTSNIAINNNNIGGVRKGSGEYSSFSSWESCISYIANLISKYYLKDDATYFSGRSIWDVNENYCENSDWADKIVSISKGLMSNL